MICREGRVDGFFFLNGVTEAATDAIRRSNDLTALREMYRGRIVQAGMSSRLLELVDHLFAHPAVTPETAAKAVGVERRQALNQINKLIELGILKEATGRRRNRVFMADGIVHAVDDTPRSLR